MNTITKEIQIGTTYSGSGIYLAVTLTPSNSGGYVVSNSLNEDKAYWVGNPSDFPFEDVALAIHDGDGPDYWF